MRRNRILHALNAALRLGLSAALLLWTVTSCAPANPPPASGGPSFVINSPLGGSSVAGPTFFSVQPFDSGAVASVQFKAGGKDLGSDTTASDGFKVFLNPKDFPAGSLKLEATLTGKDGKISVQSINVTNVPNPPSSATVGSSGAVLGTKEASGANSTLSIPPGAADGATVTFTAKTKEQVKASTGVDYDALGVTFLGAQEISASKPINAPLGLSSGGFGPMVQPNQAVVNYVIAPDGDGDGKAELMVVNGASVAPNGDVISNPVPQIQLGAATVKTASKSRTLRSMQAGTLSGPPGTFIEIEAKGFNPFSAIGNVARFRSLASGNEIELPAFVNPHYEKSNPVATIGFYIPPLPAGEATVTLANVGSGMTAAPFNISVQTSPALSKEPAVIIDETLARAIAVLSKDSSLKDAASRLEAARSGFANLSKNPTPEVGKALNDIAAFIANSNMGDLLNQLEDNGSSNLRILDECDKLGILGLMLVATLGVATMTLGIAIAVIAAASGGVALFGLIPGLITGTGLVSTAVGVGGAWALAYKCLPPPEACLPPLTPSLRTVLQPPSPVPSPESIRVQDTPPPLMITGMGSVVPPGGDSCGPAFGDDLAASSGLRSPGSGDRSVGPQSLLGDLAGRFIVKVFYGSGNSVPFTGVSDSSGYFYIPTVPAGQPFEAIAFDTLTKQTRSFKGTGPEVGQSTYMYFDFFSSSDSGAKVIGYDTNTQGVHDGTDLYVFDGKAGDLINLAVFSETLNSDQIRFQLSNPNGVPMMSGLNSGGHYFETGIVELGLDGLYSFSVDGSSASGNYTLGLSKIDLPVSFNLAAPLLGGLPTLGDHQFYSFSGKVGDVVKLTLSHDASSSLDAQLQLREPLAGVPFYQQPRRLRLATTDTQRTTTSSRTLTVAGEYVLEISHDGSPFKTQLPQYVGTYQVEVAVTP